MSKSLAVCICREKELFGDLKGIQSEIQFEKAVGDSNTISDQSIQLSIDFGNISCIDLIII